MLKFFTTTLEEVTDANLTAEIEVEYSRNGGANGNWYNPIENPFAESVVAVDVNEVKDEDGNPVKLSETLKWIILAYVNTHREEILDERATQHLANEEE